MRAAVGAVVATAAEVMVEATGVAKMEPAAVAGTVREVWGWAEAGTEGEVEVVATVVVARAEGAQVQVEG